MMRVVVVVVAATVLAGCAVTRQNLTVYPDDPRFSESAKQQYAGRCVTGTYRLRLDAERRVQAVDVVKSIRDADEGVRQTFLAGPFDLHDPAFAKSVVLDVYLTFMRPRRASNSPEYRAVRPGEVSHQLVDWKPLLLPPAALAANAGKNVFGSYTIFIERDGSVSRVDVKQSIEDGDAGLIETLKTWRFKPQPERLRTMVQLACRVPPSGDQTGAACMLH